MLYAIQIIGAVLILAAFVLGQLELLAADSWSYLSANLFGSALLTASAVIGAQWGFVLLEGCWALASLYGIVQKLRGVSPARHGSKSASASGENRDHEVPHP